METPDFLGAFAVIENDAGILMVQNERCIQGQKQLVWDLPGGRLENGELLEEALCRELREETALVVSGPVEFLFFQEGLRVAGEARSYAWRSFFFRVGSFEGTPRAGAEVLDVAWVRRDEMNTVLSAPYHDSFAVWLREGGTRFGSSWED